MSEDPKTGEVWISHDGKRVVLVLGVSEVHPAGAPKPTIKEVRYLTEPGVLLVDNLSLWRLAYKRKYSLQEASDILLEHAE